MTIVIIGAQALIARLVATGVAGDVALGVGKDKLGEDVAAEARRLVPVVSGTLQGSISYDDVEKKVYTDVEYARMIEYGGSHNRSPDPYMRPAADTVNATEALLAARAVIESA